MSENGAEKEMRRVCSVLESIAKNYPPESDEALAVRDAAFAYILVQQHETLKKAYQRLLFAAGGQLSEAMKADLRRHGIEPDELGEDFAANA